MSFQRERFVNFYIVLTSLLTSCVQLISSRWSSCRCSKTLPISFCKTNHGNETFCLPVDLINFLRTLKLCSNIRYWSNHDHFVFVYTLPLRHQVSVTFSWVKQCLQYEWPAMFFSSINGNQFRTENDKRLPLKGEEFHFSGECGLPDPRRLHFSFWFHSARILARWPTSAWQQMKAQVGTDFAQASTSGATPPSVYTASHWERYLSTLMTSQRNAQSRDRLYRRGAKSQTEQNFLEKERKENIVIVIVILIFNPWTPGLEIIFG